MIRLKEKMLTILTEHKDKTWKEASIILKETLTPYYESLFLNYALSFKEAYELKRIGDTIRKKAKDPYLEITLNTLMDYYLEEEPFKVVAKDKDTYTCYHTLSLKQAFLVAKKTPLLIKLNHQTYNLTPLHLKHVS